jgi:hypothetical protein
VGQSNSQHNKCQVGDMHAYSLDLVHFTIIPPFFHSLISAVLHKFLLLSSFLYLYLVNLRDGLKKRIFRPMRY